MATCTGPIYTDVCMYVSIQLWNLKNWKIHIVDKGNPYCVVQGCCLFCSHQNVIQKVIWVLLDLREKKQTIILPKIITKTKNLYFLLLKLETSYTFQYKSCSVHICTTFWYVSCMQKTPSNNSTATWKYLKIAENFIKTEKIYTLVECSWTTKLFIISKTAPDYDR